MMMRLFRGIGVGVVWVLLGASLVGAAPAQEVTDTFPLTDDEIEIAVLKMIVWGSPMRSDVNVREVGTNGAGRAARLTAREYAFVGVARKPWARFGAKQGGRTTRQGAIGARADGGGCDSND